MLDLQRNKLANIGVNKTACDNLEIHVNFFNGTIK